MANTLVWVDIPVLDLDRACAFYSAVLGAEVGKMDGGGFSLGLLPGAGGDSSGCLYIGENVKPSDQGPMIYLNCDGRLEDAEKAVAASGGKVLEPKHQIGPHGFRVVILDSEGNRIALHSM